MRPSKIAYCDYSGGILNFVLGCTPVSAGCANCYARRIYDRFGKDFSKVTIYPDKLERLLTWQPRPPYKRGPGSRPLAFVVDMGDLFHVDVPLEFIDDVWGVMAARSDVDWLVLTKRPQRLYEWYYQTDFLGGGDSRRNIWLGVTVENEDNLWRIDELLKTPAAVRWVSLEPMLGPIDISCWMKPDVFAQSSAHYERTGHQGLSVDLMAYNSPGSIAGYCQDCGAQFINPGAMLDWVIIGGESGPKQRPLMWHWAWDVLDYCRAGGISCFLKQDAGPRPNMPLYDRDGREVKEWPK